MGHQIFWGPTPTKSLRGVLLLTNTHPVLNFCKDPFRGVDRIYWKKRRLQNKYCRHI